MDDKLNATSKSQSYIGVLLEPESSGGGLKASTTSSQNQGLKDNSLASINTSRKADTPDREALFITGRGLYGSLRSQHQQHQQQLSTDDEDDELMIDAGRKRRISFKNRRYDTSNEDENLNSNNQDYYDSEELGRQGGGGEDDDDDDYGGNIRQVYYEDGASGGGGVGFDDSDDQQEKLLFPGYVPVAFKYFKQADQPRYICLRMITSPWFERASMLVILFNCITLGMYQPCSDTPKCSSTRCILLNYIDHMIHFFFLIEMCIKIMAMGLYGKHTYLAESWNRLDFFIVIAGNLEYVFTTQNLNLAVIRTFRVLRPLRAINRVPSMRILVMLLLDTLPMLGNVLLLCFFVFFIFGIVGVQLWKGVLRNRCYFNFNQTAFSKFIDPSFVYTFYKPEHTDSFVCADANSNGMTSCAEIPAYVNNSVVCNETMDVLLTHDLATLTRNGQPACINWNYYYTDCRPTPENPFKGAISFDNIGFAWIAIFQIISLESWVTIMYYIQDAHSFYNWIYFVCLIVIGSFFMINLCLVVIATQFSETKKRETERMIAERRRFSRSTSTLTSGDSDREPGSCWEEFIKYLIHLCHKGRKRAVSKYKKYQANAKLKKTTGKSSNDQTGPSDETYGLQTPVSLVKPSSQCKCVCHNSQPRPSARIIDETSLNIQIPITPDINNNAIDKIVTDTSNDSTTGEKPPSTSTPPALTPLVVFRCSTCGRKVSNKCESEENATANPGRSGLVISSGLNDSSVFYSSIGVPSDPMQVRDELSNHHEFYCYSARETEPPTGVETSDDEEKKTSKSRRHHRRRPAASHTNICCYLCCCCCSKQLEKTLCCRVLNYLSKKLRILVDSSFFQRTILCAILINTISMGIEHHQQPQLLTQLVEYSNFFFSCVFMVEMILKIMAYGFIDYIKNAFNMFDSIIVCISAYELVRHFWLSVDGVQSASSGVSVLRTFRLLRILKLVRFMPALRRQLIIMLKTIDNVATFFSLLCLFIFIFSILGMHLFGCKFCEKDAYGNRTVADCERKERKNFDSLLWAIITVFQVLTQEDWNEVLYNGMRFTSPWASIYFVLLMTFGNYVLFNLLVAILVEGFSTEDEPKKSLAERIKEDAIQAIQEEAQSKETSQYLYTGPGGGGGGAAGSFDPETRRTSNSSLPNRTRSVTRGKSPRRSSGLDISGRKKSKSLKSISMRSSRSSFRDTVGYSVSSMQIGSIRSKNPARSLDWHQSRAKSDSKDNEQTDKLHIEHDKKLMPLPPIITHTCPTPTHTPTSSNHSSPQLSGHNAHRRSHKEIKTDRKESTSFIKQAKRKFSLDSSHDRIKPTDSLNVQGKNSKRHHMRHSLGKKPKNSSPIPPKILIDRIDILQAKNQSSSSNDEVFVNDSPQLNTNFDPIQISSMSPSVSDKLLNLPSKRGSQRQVKGKGERARSSTTDERSSSSLQSSDNKNDQVNEIVLAGDQVLVKKGPSKNIVLKKSELYTVDIQNEPVRDTNQKEVKKVKRKNTDRRSTQNPDSIDIKLCFKLPKSPQCLNNKTDYALYLFPKDNSFRQVCMYITSQKWFDYSILFFIALNCITLAMERPSITPTSLERKVLTNSNYFFTVIFMMEMVVKIVANGFYIGQNAYLNSGWNKMDCFLVAISLVDAIVSLTAKNSPKIFGILRVFRLLRTLKPLRVISRAPGLKLVVQTLLTSLRPIGNIVLICCTFFIIFGILGVQLFKGKFYRCMGSDLSNVKTKDDCLANPHNQWINSQYNFDNLGQALMALFVLASKDGWVQIMYYGIDAVGVDKQPIDNYNEWMLLYFISFLLLVGFFVLNMFVGVVIENFHKCRAEQEKEEKARRAAKRAKKFEEKRRKMKEIPYYANYSPLRRFLHSICNSKYFDLIIAGVIGLNVVTMSLEFYKMPAALDETLDIFNYIFTSIFLIEAILRMVALGFVRYIKEKWNQLDILIVILSIAGIFFDKINTRAIPINPTIIRVMRVLRIARVLKLLKMAKGIRSLLDTVIQALPQVGNLGLLFFLLFFIFAILGVELFGKLNCDSVVRGCDGLSKHAHFHNFGMAFLTLFRIATGDNWNGIMKDTLKDNVLCQDDNNKEGSSICLASVLAPIYFVIFVLMAQFVLVNVVVAVLMKHLDESNKMQADDAEMDEEIEKQLENEARNNLFTDDRLFFEDDVQNCERSQHQMRKVNSLPPNYTFEASPETKIKTMNELIKHSSVTYQANNYLAQQQSKSNGNFFNSPNIDETAAGNQKEKSSNIFKRLLRSSSRLNSSSSAVLVAVARPENRSSRLLVERDLEYISRGLNSKQQANKLFSPSEIMPKYSYTSEFEPTTNINDFDKCSVAVDDDDEDKVSYVSINNEIDTHSAILRSSNRRQQRETCLSQDTNYTKQPLLKRNRLTSSNGGYRLSVTPDSSEVIRGYTEQDESFRFETKSHFSPASSLRIRVIDDADVNDI